MTIRRMKWYLFRQLYVLKVVYICTFVMRIVEISYNEYECILHEKFLWKK